MYKSGFAHTNEISDDNSVWSYSSTNSKACFYIDEDEYCHTNGLLQNRKEYSYVISSKSADNAYFSKTISLNANTNYVVNVMVKSTFVKDTSVPFPLLPAYISATIGNNIITSIDCVGIVGDWIEMSLGFKTGSSTSVTLKIGANFNNSSKTEAVYFSNIRIDKINTTKILFLAYNNVNYTKDGITYSGAYSGNVNQKLHAMAYQFEKVLKLVSNGKIVPEIKEYVSPNTLTHLTVTSDTYTVTMKDVLDNDGANVSGYDCIICNMPMLDPVSGHTTTFGVYQGLFRSDGSGGVDQYESLSGLTGFIFLSKPFIQDYTTVEDDWQNNDGEIHEFIHYIQDCASHLDKVARKYYPYLDDLDSSNRDIYGNAFSFKRENTVYNNYELFYEHLRDSSTYNYLFTNFTLYNADYKMKYRWYYDVLNGFVQDCYRDAGVWGMLSNWIEIGCDSIKYHMNKYLGIRPGVYRVKNGYSSKFLDSDLNSNNQITISNNTFNTDQYWEFRPAAGGSYEIIPLANYGKRIVATSASVATLANANTQIPSNQRWQVVCASSNYFTIKSVQYGTYLRMPSQSASYVTLSTSAGSDNTGYWDMQDVNVIDKGLNKIKSLFSNKYVSYLPNIDNFVKQYNYQYEPGQVWQVKRCLDGYLQIIPLSKIDSCLTTPNYVDVSVQTNTEADTQKWLIVDIGNNLLRLIPKSYPLKALDIEGPLVEEGTKIHTWDYVASANQMKWYVENFHDEGAFPCRVKSVFSNNYLKDNDNSAVQHDVVQHSRNSDNQTSSNYTYSANFIWDFQLQEDGFYKIIPLSSPYKRLTAASTTTDPAVLSLELDRNTDDQKWFIFNLGQNKYRISPKNNVTKALVLFGPVATDDAFIQLWTFNTTSEVRWYIEKFCESFYNTEYKLTTVCVPTKYMDARDDNSTAVRVASRNRDDIITIYSSNNQNTQKWQFTKSEGFYEINPKSNNNYRMSGIINSLGNPNKLRKKYADESSEQKWIIEDLGSSIYRIAPRDNPSKSLVLTNDSGFDVEGNLVQLWVYNGTSEVKIKFI